MTTKMSKTYAAALVVALGLCGAAPAADPPPDTAPAEAAAAAARLEDADARVQKGLAELAEATAGFEAERKTWASLDRSVASARAVNKAVGDRGKLVVKLYDTHVSGALADFERELAGAPAAFRRMAVLRRGQLAGATLEAEERNYRAMADLSEAAAVLCERRRAELFGDAPARPGEPKRVTAPALAAHVGTVRKLAVVHERWEETFAAYPSALDRGDLAALFDNLAAWAEDLESFTKGVEALSAAVKKKAGGSATAPATALPAPTPAAQPAPAAVAAAPVLGVFAPGTSRRLTDAELAAKVRLARPARFPVGAPVRYLAPVFVVDRLPAQPDPNAIYVVHGVALGGPAPSNVVYDSVTTRPAAVPVAAAHPSGRAPAVAAQTARR